MMLVGLDPKKIVEAQREITIGPVPAGAEALVLAELARAGQPVAYIMSDG